MKNNAESGWLSAGTVFNQSPESVDLEKGIIKGVSVITLGEAKGHGFHIDSEMLDTIVRLDQAQYSNTDRGLKSRYGHPNLSSTALGTFLGRFKNLRREGDQVTGDFFGSKSARSTPDGDLLGYILKLANEDEKAFGISTVLNLGQAYTRNEDGEKVLVSSEYDLKDDQKLFREVTDVIAADFVDDPAANPDGLFSAWNLSSVAGQVTRFLDTHPEVFQLLKEKPEIMKQFMGRYDDYLARQGLAQVYHCECIECGYKQESEQHCNDLRCPDCGGQMRREDRPGPGRVNQENRLQPGPEGSRAGLITNAGADASGGTSQTKEKDMAMEETLAALKKEFPDRPEFVIEQLTKGNNLEAAKGEFQALELKELKAANADLKAANVDLEKSNTEKDAAAEKLATENAEKLRRANEVAAGGEGGGGEGAEFQASGDDDAEVQFEALVKKYALDHNIDYKEAILKVAEGHPKLANKVGA